MKNINGTGRSTDTSFLCTKLILIVLCLGKIIYRILASIPFKKIHEDDEIESKRKGRSFYKYS